MSLISAANRLIRGKRCTVTQLCHIRTYSTHSFLSLLANQHDTGSPLTESPEIISLFTHAIQQKMLPLYPSTELKQQISEEFHTDTAQINRILGKVRRQMRRAATMTRGDARETLRKWIESHDSLRPTTEQYTQLHEETGWSKDQLYSYFYMQRQNRSSSKSLGTDEKARIKEWYETHWKGVEQRSEAPIKELCNELKLSRPQVLKYLWVLEDEDKYPHRQITAEMKQRIEEFVRGNARPTTEQISELQEELQVNRTQLHSAMSRYRDPPGIITDTAKEIIYEHINRKENALDLEMLQKITGLSKRQVHDIKRRYTKETFSLERRRELDELWDEGFRELDDFVYRSVLSREQIRKWLWQKKKDEEKQSTNHSEKQQSPDSGVDVNETNQGV